ncbi:FecR family protein [Lignipirellula cremea]|uniref:FecR protein n=1 Tax=Lignipirellula cremea TaxID=2528010 RepID=A0A518DN79_9BACT|nr:FecR family protein [Lignipirellula cremea]QDU93297.1 FecR protein [Lignipirellula cremea]
MTPDAFQQSLDRLVLGDLSPAEHEAVSQWLKSNADARAAFRERMDLEASLRTWAAQSPLSPQDQTPDDAPSRPAPQLAARDAPRRSVFSWVSLSSGAALLLLLVASAWIMNAGLFAGPTPPTYVGVLRQQTDCAWKVAPITVAGRFALGSLSLASGAAELDFDSGSRLLLEGPCELVVKGRGSAELLAGSLVVRVTEVSRGFTLATPEAVIVDEGTEYAVSLTDEAAEIHVFDGSVLWLPTGQSPDPQNRIGAGEAGRFLRSRPSVRRRIPYDERQFVRRLEAEVKQQAGPGLLAYDGFENLAGQIRRDRRGIGWSGGWKPGGDARGQLATVIDAPADVVFGHARTGRRLLQLQTGEDIRRTFSAPWHPQPGTAMYVRLLLERAGGPGKAPAGRSLQATLEVVSPAGLPLGLVTFGVTSAGDPFLNSNDVITETAAPLVDGETCACLLKLLATEEGLLPFLRLYRPGETVDEIDPQVWTVTGSPCPPAGSITSLRIRVGQNADWRIDELTAWQVEAK